MDNKKTRKTINVSLQSKKYSDPINRIINEWEDDGSNISVEVCENILLFEKFDKSIVLSNIKNVYELIEKIVALYYPLDSDKASMKIEELLSEVISVDNGKLTSALANLNEQVSVDKAKIKQQDGFIESIVTVDNNRDNNGYNQHNNQYQQQNQNYNNNQGYNPNNQGYNPNNQGYNQNGNQYNNQGYNQNNQHTPPNRVSYQQDDNQRGNFNYVDNNINNQQMRQNNNNQSQQNDYVEEENGNDIPLDFLMNS